MTTRLLRWYHGGDRGTVSLASDYATGLVWESPRTEQNCIKVMVACNEIESWLRERTGCVVDGAR